MSDFVSPPLFGGNGMTPAQILSQVSVQTQTRGTSTGFYPYLPPDSDDSSEYTQ